jgi:hypothetical protein
MNTLSILLYSADVVFTLNKLLWIILGVVFVITLFGTRYYFDQVNSREDTDDELKSIKKGGLISFKVILVSVFLLVFIPSKNTIYLIAASEVGEEVVESPVTQRLAIKIEKYLDNVLEIEGE